MTVPAELSDSANIKPFSVQSEKENVIQEIKRKWSEKKIRAIDILQSELSGSDKLYMTLLQKLMMMDSRCRDKLEGLSIAEAVNKDSDEDEDDDDTDSSHSEEDDGIHPLDLFLVTFQCCSLETRQMLVSKLFMCKLAVPLFIPYGEAEFFEACLWSLRSIYFTPLGTLEKQNDCSIVDFPFPMVGIVRLGLPEEIKSVLLNSILNGEEHSTFFHRKCIKQRLRKKESDGYIEASWFLPAGKGDEVFERELMFLNLRGDGVKHEKLLKILQNMGVFIIVMVDISEAYKDEIKACLNQIKKSKKFKILLTSKVKKDKDYRKTIRETFRANYGESSALLAYENKSGRPKHFPKLREEVVTAIKQFTETMTPEKTLEKCIEETAYNLRDCCTIDEHDASCKAGKEAAMEIVAKLDEKPDPMFPLQEAWITWSSLLKEKNKITATNKRTEEICKQMTQIRKMQLEMAKNKSSLVNVFLSKERMLNIEAFPFFIQWMQFFLSLRLHTVSYLEQMNDMPNTPSPRVASLSPYQKQQSIKQHDAIDTTVGTERFIAEIGQMHESYAANKLKGNLADIGAKMLLNGFPLQIMDGNTANIPTHWIKSVFERLQETSGNKEVLVLSVLGIQSSGKSTLLNTMFGLKFAVSAGRCTKGIYAQLLKIENKEHANLPFDFILVIDSEGLRAPELGNQRHDHDNTLSTLVIGLGDIVIVNIYGENTSEIKDFLEIAVHAFVRMKMVNRKVDWKRTCIFTHQNVSAINAKKKTEFGRERLKKMLDDMTKDVAKQEGVSFENIVDFQCHKHVWNFSGLWKGDPPMAPVNPGYSERVAEVKTQIMREIIADRKSEYTKLSNVASRICDLWEAVLAEDFVLYFRNTLEVREYNLVEQKYSEVVWEMDTYLRSLTSKLNVEQVAKKEVLPNWQMESVQKIKADFRFQKEIYLERMEKFFENSTRQEITGQWQESKKQALQEKAEELERKAILRIKEKEEKHKKRLEFNDKSASLRHELKKQSEKIAKTREDTDVPTEELEKIYNEIWKNLTSKDSYNDLDINPVEDVIETAYLENIQSCDMVFYKTKFQDEPISKLPKVKSLKNEKTVKEQVPITDDHVAWKKGFLDEYQKDLKSAKKRALRQVRKGFLGVLNVIEIEVTNRSKVNEDLQEGDVRDMLEKLSSQFENVNNENKECVLKKTILVNFTHLVCKFMYYHFSALREKQRNDKGKEKEMDKATYWTVFQSMFKKISDEVKAAKLFTDALKNPVLMKVRLEVNNEIEKNIKGKFSTKIKLLHEILDEIVSRMDRKESFDACKRYLEDAKSYCKEWIREYTNKVYFDSSTNDRESQYAALAREIIDKYVQNIRKWTTQATSDSNSGSQKKEDSCMKHWLESLSKKMSANFSLQGKYYDTIKNTNVQDLESFQDQIEKQLSELQLWCEDCFTAENEYTVSWDGSTPYARVLEDLWGCPELCPFCKEPCQYFCSDHTRDMPHRCIQHKPIGLGQDILATTQKPNLNSCCFLVTSPEEYECTRDTCCKRRTEHCQETVHQYRDYIHYTKDWFICPDKSTPCSLFWQWFIYSYQDEIKECYNWVSMEVPEDWKHVTQDDARQSLKDLFNI